MRKIQFLFRKCIIMNRLFHCAGLLLVFFDGGVFSTFCGSPERYAGDAERDRYPDAKIA